MIRQTSFGGAPLAWSEHRAVLKFAAAQMAAGAPAPSRQSPNKGGTAQQFAYVGADSRRAIAAGANPVDVGISVFTVDNETGDFTHVQTIASDNPFFFAFHPSNQFLYVVNGIEEFEGKESGSVEAYAVDTTTGKLTFLNRQSSGGATPADLAVDPSGKYLVVANYNGDNTVVLPINDDGSLAPMVSEARLTGTGPNKARQERPHPHSALYDPSGKHVVVADLGSDRVVIYRLDLSTGQLNEVGEAKTTPGDGPRHVAFNQAGTLIYVLGEMSAVISVFSYDTETGTVGDLYQRISTIPDPFVGTMSTAEIFLHPSGKFLYNSNRGQPDSTTPEGDAIVGFTIAAETGHLSLIGHAMADIAEPWSFEINTAGTFLYAANHLGDSITRFAIDQTTGVLTRSGELVVTPAPFVVTLSRF